MASKYAHITGVGTYVPSRILTNAELADTVDTSDEWIRSVTGIRNRRIAAKDETTASLASIAALNALKDAGVPPSQVDLIIVATSSPEYIFPATACIVQDNIGAKNAGAYDISAACAGFLIALNSAAQAIKTGSISIAVVIGAETLSKIVNWNDRNTCILFGDGAGAFVLEASDIPGGVLADEMRSDGSGASLLSLPGGGSKYPQSEYVLDNDLQFISMNGREVFRFASRVMVQSTNTVLRKVNLRLKDIDLIIPHQANKRIIEAAARGLKLPLDKFIINIEEYGNTSTASIPLAVADAIREEKLVFGNKIVLVGFGGGLTWGAVVVDWTGRIDDRKPTFAHRFTPIYRWFVRVRSVYRNILRKLEGWIWGRKQ